MNIHSGFQLTQQQTTKLMITPEMKQAIKILQSSREELSSYVQEQLMENPMLEEDKWTEERDHTVNGINHLNSADRGLDSYPSKEQEGLWEFAAPHQKSLVVYLEEQLAFLSMEAKQKQICLFLIGNLNEYGFLDLDHSSFSIDEQQFETCLSIIQSLEPVGVGARTLAECLEIQLRHQHKPNKLAIQIARQYLPEVADGKWKKIASELAIDVRMVQQAVDRIKQCNPRPCANYFTAPLPYVYPDVTIEKLNGTFQIILNEDAYSRIRLHSNYQEMMKQTHLGQDVQHYLKDRYHSAQWLIKSINQRNHTIYEVTKIILIRQMDFFEHGISHLKPLMLHQIAKDLHLHESTISRTTQNKYMQTAHGLFPFRYFFPSGLNQEITSNLVKDKLQQMIEQESKHTPLSDQKLADLLKKMGIPISRRTVTKYREQMGIASSASRKRYVV